MRREGEWEGGGGSERGGGNRREKKGKESVWLDLNQ